MSANPEVGSLLQEYRKLKKETEERKNELTSLKNCYLSEIVSRVNDLVTKVNAPQECRLDAEVFSSLVHCSDIRTRRLSLSAPFLTPMDCVSKIKEKYSIIPRRQSSVEASPDEEEIDRRGVRIDWRTMGENFSQLLNSVPPVHCMLGFMELEPKARPPTERKKRTKLVISEEVVAPFTRETTEGADYDSHLAKYIKKLKTVMDHGTCVNGIDIMCLTIDHDSYIDSVMYVFALSFLVNYGQVRLQNQGDRVLAFPVSREEAKRKGDEHKQIAVQMTMEKWRNECERLSREECKMTSNQS
eukprot:g1948.t1